MGGNNSSFYVISQGLSFTFREILSALCPPLLCSADVIGELVQLEDDCVSSCQGFPRFKSKGEQAGPLAPDGSSLSVHRASVPTFNLVTPVSVSSGCVTKHHQLYGLNNTHLFSHSPGVESLRSRCWQGWFFLRPFSLVYR